MQQLAQPQFHLYVWIKGQRRQAACWKWSENTSITTQDEPWFLMLCLAALSASLLRETLLGPWPPTDLGVGFTSKKCNKHFAVLMLTVVCLFLGTQHSHPPMHCLYHKEPKHTQKQIWLAQDSARCGSVGPRHQPGTPSACNCCSPQISGRFLPGTTRSRVYQENLSSCIPLWSSACTKKKKLERVARWKQKAKHVRAQLSRSVFVLPPSSSHMLPAELTRGVLELDFFSFASCCLHRISDSAARCSLMPEQDE